MNRPLFVAFGAITGLSLVLHGVNVVLARTRKGDHLGTVYTMGDQVYLDQLAIDHVAGRRGIHQGPRWSRIILDEFTLTVEPAVDALQTKPERLYRLRHPDTDANAEDGDEGDSIRELAQGLSRRKNDKFAREFLLLMASRGHFHRQILA
ncbi:MAG: hypothetical protein IPK80_19820 [Nannocystis sp.]|nr:hypothetical protein [Nannocystis sp.]